MSSSYLFRPCIIINKSNKRRLMQHNANQRKLVMQKMSKKRKSIPINCHRIDNPIDRLHSYYRQNPAHLKIDPNSKFNCNVLTLRYPINNPQTLSSPRTLRDLMPVSQFQSKTKQFNRKRKQQRTESEMIKNQQLGLQIKRINPSSINERLVVALNDHSNRRNKNYMDDQLNQRTQKNQRIQKDKRLVQLMFNKTYCTARSIKTPQVGPSMQNVERADKIEQEKAMRRTAFNSKLITIDGTQRVYQQRFFYYIQLISLVTFAHNKILDIQFNQFETDTKYHAYIGPGNNSVLIKSLIRRRFWWTIESSKCQEINLVWTQLKQNQIFRKQTKSSSVFKFQFQQFKENQKLRKKIIQSKLLSDRDLKSYHQLMTKNKGKSFHSLLHTLQGDMYRPCTKSMVHNHLSRNYLLGNKKTLFYNMRKYYEKSSQQIFNYLPITFHVKKGTEDPQFILFQTEYKKRHAEIIKILMEKGNPPKNLWLVKPGQSSNQGRGITVVRSLDQVRKIINNKQKHSDGSRKTYIIQAYMHRPMLFQGRKFDIRHYILVTSIHGIRKGYWYQQGYVRTSSMLFNYNKLDSFIHLTNDAVQKKCQDYGKYEIANKISYEQLHQYLLKSDGNFYGEILPNMKKIGTDAIRCGCVAMDPDRLQHNFEIFGLDFMIDQSMRPWLIEVNTNPCLQLVSPLLAKIIPNMVDNALRLSLDIVFPPPCHYPNTAKHLAPNNALFKMKFELVFDERCDSIGQILKDQIIGDQKQAQNQVFESDEQGQNFELQ